MLCREMSQTLADLLALVEDHYERPLPLAVVEHRNIHDPRRARFVPLRDPSDKHSRSLHKRWRGGKLRRWWGTRNQGRSSSRPRPARSRAGERACASTPLPASAAASRNARHQHRQLTASVRARITANRTRPQPEGNPKVAIAVTKSPRRRRHMPRRPPDCSRPPGRCLQPRQWELSGASIGPS